MKIELGFVGILTIVFVLLKAFEKITWSWIWIFSPLWISVIFIIFILIFGLILVIINNEKERRKEKR